MSNSIRHFINLIENNLTEAPLADYEFFGDPNKEGSLRQDDLRMINSSNWLKKVKSNLSKTPMNFNIYVYNLPDENVTYKNGNSFNVRDTNPNNIQAYGGWYANREEVERLIGKKIPDAEQSITFLVLSNEGSGKIKLSPWILVHRFVHSVIYKGGNARRSSNILHEKINELMKYIYQIMYISGYISSPRNSGIISDDEYIKIANQVFTFGSARNGSIDRLGEYYIESFAQYIIKGNLILNNPAPENADYSRNAFIKRVGGAEIMDMAETMSLHDFVEKLFPEMSKPTKFEFLVYKENPDKEWPDLIDWTKESAKMETLKAQYPESEGYNYKLRQSTEEEETRYKLYQSKEVAYHKLLTCMYTLINENIIDFTISPHENIENLINKYKNIFDKRAFNILRQCQGGVFIL